MQKNDQGLKRKLLFDGEEVPGLVETGDIKDEEGTIEVPSFSRKTIIKDGVKFFDPIDCVYKIAADTITQKFFYDWFTLNQYKDVTAVETDATGAEINRWLLRDCENTLFNKRTYNAGGIEFHGVAIRLTCTATPVRLDS